MDVRERDFAETTGPFDRAPADLRATTESRGSNLGRVVLWGPLGVLLVLWLWLFIAEGAFDSGPNGRTFEADFAMYYAAGQMLQRGDSPYDHAVLFERERALLRHDGLSITRDRAIVRVGNPPLFFWLLRPLLALRFQVAALIWGAALYVGLGLGLWLLLLYLGHGARVLTLAPLLAMPQVVLGAFYGNVAPLAFVGVGGALFVGRRTPLVAGSLLAVAWLKPPVALPIALLVILFHTTSRIRALTGFILASCGCALITVAVLGRAVASWWLHGLTQYSSDIATSPGIASAAGLYVRSLGPHARLGLQLLAITVALVLTARVWVRVRHSGPVSLASLGWLWCVWFLATPYAHIYDEVLLAAPLLAFVLQPSLRVSGRYRALVAYAIFSSLLVVQAAPHRIQLLPLPLIVVALCLALAPPAQRRAAEMQRAVA